MTINLSYGKQGENWLLRKDFLMSSPMTPLTMHADSPVRPSLTAQDFLTPRHDWTTEEISILLEAPLMDLVYTAQTVHRHFHPDNTVQLASLLSIKTGSCPENCKYCPQSAHYAKKTGLEKQSLLEVEAVLEKAREAKAHGSSRFCMGAAWREVKDGEAFDQVIDMVKGVRELGMEACVTLGMLNADQAKRLAEAGLTAYNHNLDTSPEYYTKIITTRTYEDRLNTLDHVRQAGIQVCCGGIIGMGEAPEDRASLLRVLSTLTPHPESVPINALVAVKGTPLEDQTPLDPLEMVRMIAVARLVLPRTRVRLSAGRKNMSKETQILCMMAGANSLFYGDKLLTTDNNEEDDDLALIQAAGLQVEGLHVERQECRKAS
jgi:biotin synthase